MKGYLEDLDPPKKQCLFKTFVEFLFRKEKKKLRKDILIVLNLICEIEFTFQGSTSFYL